MSAVTDRPGQTGGLNPDDPDNDRGRGIRQAVREQIRTDKRAATAAAGAASTEKDPRAGAQAYRTVAGNSIANYAIGLLVALIVLLVAALVGGEFAAAIPGNSPFSEAINTTVSTAGTAFQIFGVTLIVLPGVAAVVLIVRGMGGVMGR